MTEAQRRILSRVLFALALPVCVVILVLGWDSNAWQLAKPVALGVAGLAWWIAPKSEKPEARK